MYSSMNLFIDCAGSHDLAQTTVSVIGTNLSHMVCVSAECINIMISLQLCLHSSTQDVLYSEMQYNVCPIITHATQHIQLTSDITAYS